MQLTKVVGLWLAVGLVLLGSVVVGAEAELQVLNGNFETLVPGAMPSSALGKTPFGFSVTGGGDHWSIGLSDARSLDGSYSLLVDIHGEGGGVHVASKPIPVEAGKTYAALWNVYNTLQPPTYAEGIHLYLEFWGEDGFWGKDDLWSAEAWAAGQPGKWTTTGRVGVYWTKTEKFGQWTEMVVSGVAPAGAKYATLSLWTARRTMKSYVDGIRFAQLD